MDIHPEKPWRRNVANVLVVNSIFAAISAIIVQIFVTADRGKYGLGWLICSVGSLILFVVSTEQLGESILEDDISLYVRSSIFYNVGVLLLFLELGCLVAGYEDIQGLFIAAIYGTVTLIWWCRWGCDTLFLLWRDDNFEKWKDRLEGKDVEGQVLDHCDRVRIWVRAYWIRGGR